MRISLIALLAAVVSACPAAAQDGGSYNLEARAILQEHVEIDTTDSSGSTTKAAGAMAARPDRRGVVTPMVLLASPASPGKPAAQGNAGDIRLMAVAKYVAIGYDTGDRFVPEFDLQASRETTPADRKAYLEVRKQFEKWHRYVLVDRPADAELLIGVRAGRFLSAGGAIQGGGNQPVAGTAGQSREIQVSAPHDMLTVRDRAGSLLWRQQLSDGLTGPEVPLFEKLRTAVEAGSKRP